MTKKSVADASTPAAAKAAKSPPKKIPTPEFRIPIDREDTEKKKTVYKNVNMAEELLAAVKVAAAKDNTNITLLVQAAVTEYLTQKGHPTKVN